MSRHSHVEPHSHHEQEESSGGTFINLHVHSEYSTLDGVNKVKEYPAICKNEHGAPAVAMTDHGNVAGAWAFYNSCRATGIKPIIGMEAYYAVGPRHLRERDALGKPYYHLILLAKDNNGLHNLFKISSGAYTEGLYYKPRADDDLLAQHADGIIATSACLGSRSSALIMRGEYKAAEAVLAHHAAMFKDRFFLELQVHKLPEQAKVNQVLLEISKKLNLPIVLTADAHYSHREHKAFHETTLRMATESSGDGFSFGDIECHLSSHDDMWARARDCGIPYEAISNTLHIADMVNADSYFSDRMNRWPKFKSLPEGVTSWEYLDACARQGLYARVGFPVPHHYEERLDRELAVFKKMGRLCDYMLMVAEYVAKAKELGVMVGPGRGSAVGSLVAYSLGITEIDPLQYGLLFERFINEGRAATPLIF